MSPSVAAIQIAHEERGSIHPLESVRAVAGLGLEGDRYYARALAQENEPQSRHEPAEEITLISTEGIEAARADAGFDITFEDTRRNIATEGVDLSVLLGRSFKIGEVEIEGLADNPPCAYLQRMIGKPLLKPLMGRAGIRGRIVTSGTIRVGDPIEVPS